MFLFVFLLFVSSALFSVMCYNVLCDKYATRQLYGYCPTWALNWEYRKKSIMQEIMGCNADIISLQVRDVIVSFTGSLIVSILFSIKWIQEIGLKFSHDHTQTQNSVTHYFNNITFKLLC